VTEKLVWHVVKEFAAEIGISKLAPHDLRPTIRSERDWKTSTTEALLVRRERGQILNKSSKAYKALNVHDITVLVAIAGIIPYSAIQEGRRPAEYRFPSSAEALRRWVLLAVCKPHVDP
jgi:hypothetical protein